MKTAIGLMSGTSMDGIDVALLKTDGIDNVEFGPSIAVDYPPSTRKAIEAGLGDAAKIVNRNDRPGRLQELEALITQAHAEATLRFLDANQLDAGEIDVIGFHGQTVLHRPEEALTVQLGDGKALADATGCDVVYDMRANDMIFGGQGAPLVPVFHAALAKQAQLELPLAFVNIGGISNISYVGEGDELFAFDTGPGNALIDQLVQAIGGIPFDQGGRIASEGRVLVPVVSRYLSSDFFDKNGPKSLDRGDFPPLEDEVDFSDGARSLARVTAEAIFKAIDHLPREPREWIICGGGRLNSMIMSDLKELADIEETRVIIAEEAGFQGDMLEAQAFAYLAVRSLEGLPLTFPKTTGCREPVSGGVLARPRDKDR